MENKPIIYDVIGILFERIESTIISTGYIESIHYARVFICIYIIFLLFYRSRHRHQILILTVQFYKNRTDQTCTRRFRALIFHDEQIKTVVRNRTLSTCFKTIQNVSFAVGLQKLNSDYSIFFFFLERSWSDKKKSVGYGRRSPGWTGRYNKLLLWVWKRRQIAVCEK